MVKMIVSQSTEGWKREETREELTGLEKKLHYQQVDTMPFNKQRIQRATRPALSLNSLRFASSCRSCHFAS
jgi:hypothetical protein